MAVMGKKKRIVTLVTVHAILILLVFTALFPIALVVLNSFKPHVAIVANPLSWPESFIPVNYSSAWSYAKFGIGFKNSIILAACTIVIVLFASTLGGYVLATRRGKVVNLALVYFMIVMTIPIQLFLFPLYYVMSYLKVPQNLSTWLLSLTSNRTLLVLLLLLMMLVLGCFMDMGILILLTTPILFPIATGALGFNPYHFGVVLVLAYGIGLCTPPVGTSLFIGCSIAKVPVEKVVKGFLPFYLSMIIMLLLLTFIPPLSLGLPKLMGLL